MINRRISTFFESYYATTNKALLVTGARQTGKTFSIRHFGTQFKTFVEINFVSQPEAADLIAGAKGVDDLILRIQALTRKQLVPSETLVFFDEVQMCPEIVTAIKFLVDDGRYRYIMSGSLLGVELKDLRSEPVGYMDVIEMFPLTFHEFALAAGMPVEVMDSVQSAWESRQAVDDFVHSKMMELFRLYMIVGGMPAAVKQYLATNNLMTVRAEQQAILRLYQRDIAQYNPDRKLQLDEIFSLIPAELNAKNKRFVLKDMNEKAKFSRLTNEFLWLKDAGVALPVYNVEEPRQPLLLSKCRNLFKLFQNDVGLLMAQYPQSLQVRILTDDTYINYGAIYENIVAQALAAQQYPLYYFNSKKQGEVDFVIEYEDTVLPIEVKSGKDYTRHNALSNLLRTTDYGINQAVVLHNGNLRVTGNVIYAPIYMVTFMQRPEPQSLHYAIDLSGLK